MRAELRASGTPDAVVDDAVLILSELLSNACRHARPLPRQRATDPAHGGSGDEDGDGDEGYDAAVRADWHRGPAGEVTVAVTDGGGPTRPLAAKPSVTARGGRGLAIITSLAQAWGVRENVGRTGVTVWAVVTVSEFDRRRKAGQAPVWLDRIEGLDGFEGLDGISA